MQKDEPSLTPAKGLRVLVIDDEKNIRATLALCLEQIGCEVTSRSFRRKPRWKRWRDSGKTSRFLTYAWDSQAVSISFPNCLLMRRILWW